MTPFTSQAVADKFNAYPAHARGAMLALRELLLRTASATPGVGALEETLKWGEPAYVTLSKSGSTVRMDWKARSPQQYALYFNCQTTLVETFRTMFPNDLQCEGNRALVFQLDQAIPADVVAMCIAAALTYHLKGKTG